ncbi:MAG: C_GCAxxG_C_C family protein [Deltaproteobacteria bacterium]|nr:C_GCAxxG_C_C family protein [Deltaproteobacteria bacterium]
MTTEKKDFEITIPDSPDWPNRVSEKAFINAKLYGSCTQSIFSVFLEEFQIDDPLLIRAAGAMHVGMLTSLTCGIHSAAMMVFGLVMGRENLKSGHDGLIPIMGPGQHLVGRITDTIGGHSCLSLSGTDFSDLNQAIAFRGSKAAEKCLYRMKNGAGEIARFLQEMSQKGEIFRFA